MRLTCVHRLSAVAGRVPGLLLNTPRQRWPSVPPARLAGLELTSGAGRRRPSLLQPTAKPVSDGPECAATSRSVPRGDPHPNAAAADGNDDAFDPHRGSPRGRVNAALASDRSVTAQAVRALMTTDVRPELHRITAPLTIVYVWHRAYGVAAEAIDELFRTAYFGASGIRLERIDGSFHFIMFDQPAAVAAAVNLAGSETRIEPPAGRKNGKCGLAGTLSNIRDPTTVRAPGRPTG